MRYATWTLLADPHTGELTGPVAAAVSQGVKLEPIMFVGDFPDNLVLGKYSSDIANLEAWNFTEISKETAVNIFSSSFIPMPEDLNTEVKGITLQDALIALFE